MEAGRSRLAEEHEPTRPASAAPKPPRLRRVSRSLCRALHFANVRRRLEHTAHRQFFDLFLVIAIYFCAGTVFYALSDEQFSVTYAFFYSASVGLGVGYGNLSIRDVFTKWFTVFYMLIGSSVVTGSFALFFKHILQRAEVEHHHVPKILAAGCIYLVTIGYGLVIAYRFQRFGNVVDALVFVVSNYTSAGLINPKHQFGSLLSTTISLLVGVPANFVFMGHISNKVLAQYDDDDDDEESTPPEAKSAAVEPSGLGRPVTERARHRNYCRYLEDQLLETGAFSPGQLDEARATFLGHAGHEQDQAQNDETGDSLTR